MPKMASKVSLASSISPQDMPFRMQPNWWVKVQQQNGEIPMWENKCFVNCEDVFLEECLLHLSKKFCRKFLHIGKLWIDMSSFQDIIKFAVLRFVFNTGQGKQPAGFHQEAHFETLGIVNTGQRTS